VHVQFIRREFRPMLALATPVVIAEVGWVTMGIVDTLMVGRLGGSAIAAVGLTGMLFFGVTVFSMGLLLGLDPLVAQAFGARRLDECHRWLVDGLWLSAIAGLPSIGVVFAMDLSLGRWGFPPDVLAFTRPYLAILAWSLAPLMLYAAFRRYLQAMAIVRPVTITLIVANVVNALGNWLLIFGHFGAPVMGVRGSAYSTLIARIFMAVALFAVILRHESRVTPRLRDTPMHLDLRRVRALFTLGFPAAGQLVLEVGVFSAATALAGRVSAPALAAHQIALNLAGLMFMVPYGLASAAAVRVGHAVGRHDGRGASIAGWTAILLGATFMSASAIVFLTARGFLIRLFTPDAAVIGIGVSLLFVAAVFQLFDGVQGVTTGALRGLGDTRTAMYWNLGGHWLVGLPLGYYLCFGAGRGVVGLWWGLSMGLIICGVALLLTWIRKGTALVPLASASGMGRPA
jgi:MATE family multidrug resistance protein